MNKADIYRAVILRAVNGPRANVDKVEDLARLNRICDHLVDCEEAQRILRGKGYGKSGMSFVELAASVPDHVRGLLKGLFRPAGAKMAEDRAALEETFDIWSSR
ncbi:MAG: hypothetical protein ACXU85_01750 [Xanthobacteraceae bacterium]